MPSTKEKDDTSRQRVCECHISRCVLVLMSLSESRVEDEYEIDPKQNEGANFQFHDVKRRKEDRQKMHGTDCECCREVSFRRSIVC